MGILLGGLAWTFHPFGDLFAFPSPLVFVETPEPKEKLNSALSIGDKFVGEELHYKMGFWLFHNAAKGKIAIQKGDAENTYITTFVGQTQGLIGLLTANRRYTLTSTMEVIEDGRRFRTLKFEQRLTTRHKDKTRIHTFDYEARKIMISSKEKDRNWRHQEKDLPYNQSCDDPITSFYNFRFGVYGTVDRGRSFKIPTIPKKRRSSISIHIASREIEDHMREQEDDTDGKEFFATMIMHKEFTVSDTGKLEGWLSKELIPVTGRVRDVIILGDVYGTLTQRLINSRPCPI